jgi:hypothetical protein
MTKPTEWGARVDGKRYCESPEMQRVSFVVGMIEMFDVMLRYVGPGQRARFETMSKFAQQLDTVAITKMFDAYMNADIHRQKFAANGNFLLALSDASGFDNRSLTDRDISTNS